jgi:hypothetical protein
VRNTASCSFPLMTFIALYVIDQRQEHNSVLRFRQFGHLYDRCPPCVFGPPPIEANRLVCSYPVDRYEPNGSFFFEMVSILRRGAPRIGVCVRACARACVRACVRVCVCGCSSLVR